jgi:hypothetical protein
MIIGWNDDWENKKTPSDKNNKHVTIFHTLKEPLL